MAEDGRASERQARFIDRHEAICEDCQREHALTMAALAEIKAARLEPANDPGFEARFIRRWRVERRARAVSYWMPAIAGAVITCAALLAVLQILFASPAHNTVDPKGKEASLDLGTKIEIPAYGTPPSPGVNQ